jgi:DNA polymerase-3 subunit gamma/tau
MAKQKPPKDPQPALAAEQSPGYTVLARRYRPQTFADLVGQEPVARALTNALRANRVAHAYLFTGARGVGKTSTARILAKALNCVRGPTPEPCGVCDVCASIATGEDVDVLEIDGASNRRIDEVRDIRANVQYAPARARYKIYIIDEVHMLTKEAFNALLKTLEEPPPHVKFIFATTEVDKVPITILSRCQRFDFAGIALPRIVERLRAILAKEGLRADDEALELLARRAGGSMRDAQSLLDQLLAFGGDRLTTDDVHRLLGTAGDERIVALADAVAGRDAKKALDLLDEALVGGLQLGEMLEQLLAYWRDLMVAHVGGTDGRDLSVPPSLHETLRRHAGAFSLDAILAGLDVLAAAKARMRGSNHGRILVEMALVRLTRLADLVSLAQLAQALGRASPGPPAPARALPPEGVKKKAPPTPANGATPAPEAVQDLNADSLPLVWEQILASVGGILAAELNKGGIPAISGPNTLVLHFPAAYNQAKAFCEAPDRVRRVEEAVRKLAGPAWGFRVESGPAAAENEAAGSPEGSPAPSAPRPRRNLKEEAEKVPLVRRAMDVLGATIQRVDDGFGSAAAPAGEAGNGSPDPPSDGES